MAFCLCYGVSWRMRHCLSSSDLEIWDARGLGVQLYPESPSVQSLTRSIVLTRANFASISVLVSSFHDLRPHELPSASRYAWRGSKWRYAVDEEEKRDDAELGQGSR